jgi:hypothetical protein
MNLIQYRFRTVYLNQLLGITVFLILALLAARVPS